MIDIEKFKAAVDEAKTKFNTDTDPIDLEDKSELLAARMDWLLARDNLCIVEGTLDTANAQHLALDFKQHAIDHVASMRKYGSSPATNAILDLYAPMLNIIYTTKTEVVNQMPPLPEVAGEEIPRTID